MAKKVGKKKATAKRPPSKKKSVRTGASRKTKKKISIRKARADKARNKTARRVKTGTESKSVRVTGKKVAKTSLAKVKKDKQTLAKKSSPAKAVKKKARRPASMVDKPPATQLDPIQFPEKPKPMPKTYLTAKELREFKELLLSKRRELAGDVNHLTDHITNRNSQGDGQHSSMPIHMADIGSDNWEHEFTIGLIASEHALLREIDEALDRIESKTYGVCLATHKKISKARLRAKLWAKYCIDYARARDEGRAP